MRTIWIVRHGEPDFPGGKKICLGSKIDLHLGQRGMQQAKALHDRFANEPITSVYCSPLARSVETAMIISDGKWPVYCLDYLKEIDVGEWEGKSFEDIRTEYPELYRQRGLDNSIIPPGGEPLQNGLDRMCFAIAMSRGNCIIVGHSRLNHSLLAKLSNTPNEQIFDIPQPYGSINMLTEDGGKLELHSIGVMPNRVPSEGDLLRFCKKCRTPQNIIAHCLAVAQLSTEIAEKLEKKQPGLDRQLLYAAAVLHDIKHTEPDHAEASAKFIRMQGYPDISDVVRCHHDISDEHIEALDECAILYLADKLVCETERVSLEERFAVSSRKCTGTEAIHAHERRYEAAIKIREKIKTVTGAEF